MNFGQHQSTQGLIQERIAGYEISDQLRKEHTDTI
jgi:hypothetical protein